MRRVAGAVLGLGLWLAAGGALAQTPAEPSTLDARIAEALALRVEHRDAEALTLLTTLWEETHSARARAQMARAEQALGRWLDAERHMGEALAVADDPWIAARRASLEQERRFVREHLGRIEVLGGVPGASVRVDGREGGALPLAEPLWASAGTVVLEVSAEGYVTAQRTVSVTAGATARETLTLVPVRVVEAPVPRPEVPVVVRPPARTDPPTRSPVWSTLGVASLVTGGVLLVGGVASHVARETLVASAAGIGCGYDEQTGAVVGGMDCPERVSTIDLSTALMATGYVSGALLLGAGVALLATAPRRGATGAQTTLMCAPTWGGARCALRF